MKNEEINEQEYDSKLDEITPDVNTALKLSKDTTTNIALVSLRDQTESV